METTTSMMTTGNSDSPAIVRIPKAIINRVKKELSGIPVVTLSDADIMSIGIEAEDGLHKVLNDCISLINANSDSSEKLSKIIEAIRSGINGAELPDLMRQIENQEPSTLKKITAFIRRRRISEVIRDSLKEAQTQIGLKSSSLSSLMDGLESQLRQEVEGCAKALVSYEEFKIRYAEQYDNFLYWVAYCQIALEKIDNQILKDRSCDQRQANRRSMLASRLLALEMASVRFPIAIGNIDNIVAAGNMTLQETITSANQQFIAIKETLIALNNALLVQNIQSLSFACSTLQDNLNKVSGQAVTTAVERAAKLPAENRAVQLRCLKELISQQKTAESILESASRNNNDAMSKLREELAAIHTNLQPRADTEKTE